jgi:hypothetical protein
MPLSRNWLRDYSQVCRIQASGESYYYWCSLWKAVDIASLKKVQLQVGFHHQRIVCSQWLSVLDNHQYVYGTGIPCSSVLTWPMMPITEDVFAGSWLRDGGIWGHCGKAWCLPSGMHYLEHSFGSSFIFFSLFRWNTSTTPRDMVTVKMRGTMTGVYAGP